MRRTPVLIVGGGPAGSAAAITLGRGGVAAELIERTSGPRDVVCGGFLGWDALAALKQLGLDVSQLGARPIHKLRVAAGGSSVEAKLPRPAAGLSRKTLDAALLTAAAGAGTTVSRGIAVRTADPHGGSLRLDNGQEIRCDTLFLATGKHELRGLARPLGRWREEPAVGLRTTLPPTADLHRRLEGVIELHLFDQGYAGLLLQEDGTANLCLSISRQRLAAAGSAPGLLSEILREAPLLAKHVSHPLPPKWIAVAGVDYGWRARETIEGLFRIGDQSAVIASLAGDGVAIALTSGMTAAAAMLSGGAAAAPHWQRGFADRSRFALGVAGSLRRLVERSASRAALMSLVKLAPDLASKAAHLTRIDPH